MRIWKRGQRNLDCLLYTSTRKVDIFVPSDKLYLTLEEASEWGHTMGVGTIGALNDAVSAGRIQEIILIQEEMCIRDRIRPTLQNAVSAENVRNTARSPLPSGRN